MGGQITPKAPFMNRKQDVTQGGDSLSSFVAVKMKRAFIFLSDFLP